jgi:molecular chaperone HscC
MTRLCVGIDLGTTYSLASVVTDGQPRVIKNAMGDHLMPSAVHVAEDGTVLVGAAARAKLVTAPARTAVSFKRDMGTNKRYELGNKSFSAVELSALVLGALKQDVEAELGQPIVEAVVTVPAYFGELQRQATRAACELAGLPVERIINEPTAAALAYGLHEKHRELRAVVLDLGGGTFDVTVLEILEGVIEIQASAGDLQLGGEDFVTCLAEHCARILQRDQQISTEGVEVQARLREACEFAKRRLSTEDATLVALPSFPTKSGAVDLEVRIVRTEFEELCRPLLNRMSNAVLRALRDAKAAPEHIDEVLLVGGSTRMPCVARLASQLFGKLPLRVLPPDEAVAMGAAIQVALKRGDAAVGDLVVTDIAPFTLGLASGSHTGGTLVKGLFSPIIERGTVLPASRVERFTTVSDGQRKILLEIFQGEHSLCSQNQKLGSYELSGIPAAPAGEEPVDVRFSYDMNGVLDVDATIVSTGKTATFTIESGGRMSKKQLEEARARLARLKFHPRDALPNVTALARADALFVELVGQDRARLGAYIASFRGAMDRQDRAAIEAERESLRRITAELESQHRGPRP